jgi:hypothetical protein
VEILGAERLVQMVFPDVMVMTGDLLEAHRTSGEDESRPASTARPDSSVVGRFGPASPAAVGAALEVAVDMDQAHLFDPDTQLPI